jgi:hypothetical protein
VGLLVGDADVDVPVLLADVLEDCLATVEHGVEDVLTSVVDLLPLVLEGNGGL